uniref:Uncharacterized protein n=1 Tax=Ditylenchus dipsaci TaxID=166011 RepID=A0A915EQ71_9BILA
MSAVKKEQFVIGVPSASVESVSEDVEPYTAIDNVYLKMRRDAAQQRVQNLHIFVVAGISALDKSLSLLIIHGVAAPLDVSFSQAAAPIRCPFLFVVRSLTVAGNDVAAKDVAVIDSSRVAGSKHADGIADVLQSMPDTNRSR